MTEAVASARAKAAEEAAEEARRLEHLQAYMRRSDWVGVEPVTAIDIMWENKFTQHRTHKLVNGVIVRPRPYGRGTL